MCSFFLDNFHSQLAGSLYGSLIVTYSISLNRPIRSMSDLFDDPIIQKLNLKQTLPVDLLSLRFIFVCSRVFFSFSSSQETDERQHCHYYSSCQDNNARNKYLFCSFTFFFLC